MSNQNLSGMTLNERLFLLGLIEEFDRAAVARNRDSLVALLMKVQLSEQEAKSTVDAVLSNPSKFGF